MINANDVRNAHHILDELDARAELSQAQEKLLRSFLPELPKQKTLEKICEYVDDAWFKADGPELKEWLHELHAQLQGLKDTPVAAPALPAGMRLADHKDYGRCVVSPGLTGGGLAIILALNDTHESGAMWAYTRSDSLTFAEEPAKPAHPEFLETEADYGNAPEGTIVACEDSPPWYKSGPEWLSVDFCGAKDDKGMSRARRRVLRWGNE